MKRNRLQRTAVVVITIASMLLLYPSQAMVHAAQLTAMSDTMTRLQISVADVVHQLVFTPGTALENGGSV